MANPSFVDLQINGCWGVDFNTDEFGPEDWLLACTRLKESGVDFFLPTLITDSVPRLIHRLNRLVTFCQPTPENLAKPVGIHLEGPFLSPIAGYIGAHPSEHACPANIDVAKQLLEAGQGFIKMVTLAPEMDPTGSVTDFYAKQGLVVSAGHTNATRDDLARSIDHGLKCFTHLGNGCPSEIPRHDNIIHRVASFRDQLHVTLVADGFHLPMWLLRMFIEWFSVERSIIVSDAISAAGLPPGYHTLGSRRVYVDTDGVPRSEDGDGFVGSGTTLDRMYQILQAETTWTNAELNQLCSTNAKQLLNL
jgi:N-acetylglucosamine-6-phosphate deacetylase